MHVQPFFILLIVTVLSACTDSQTPDQDPPAVVSAVTASYTGSESCGTCHAVEWNAWQGSHHDLALQPAGAESVLGAFDGVHLGTGFHRQEGGFEITPEDGESATPVLYTFGVEPLQQYVVPAERGALQTYPLAWDQRPAEAGGQRWFNLNEDTYTPGDPMHWTGRANRWNSQCADCHSTGVRKNYDLIDRSYATTFEVEDVGCEACHGPGSAHIADPAGSPLPGIAAQGEQIEVCAPCHSRRSQLAEGFKPGAAFLDYYSPRLLVPGLYHVDGQIDDEVYVFGSFLQSRMHRAGVTCSNCHEPHSATLKRPGNETCTFCHQTAPDNEFADLSAGNYDTTDHHLHAPDSPGAQCVACHMPAKTYMGVDDRRDHSFRIPRPDFSESLGVPNPCVACHEDGSPAWASEVIRDHFGDSRPDHFATVFARADAAEPGVDADLAALVADEVQPIMVRASALARLAGYQRGYTLDAIRLARNGEPLLRYAAPLAAVNLAADTRWRLLAPLLEDELRAVRHQAVSALMPTLSQDPAYRQRLIPHLDAWLADQKLNLDFPETLTNVAGAHLALGNFPEAEAALLEALALQANWVPGLLNLADLFRVTGRDPEAGPLMDRALAIAPEQPEVVYGYALWLSRQGRLEEGLPYFEQAAVLAPQAMQFAYTWAVALNDTGQGERAVAVLEGILERWPDDQQALMAVITMLRDQQRFSEALPPLDRLLLLRPGDSQLIQFRATLAAAAGAA